MKPSRGNMQITPVSGGDSVSMEWAWYGPPPDEAPTLVLLHEGLGCISMWRDFPEKLGAATGCGVLVYSRQGYGGSDPVTLPRPVSYMHDEALQLLGQILDYWHIRRTILVGHSDGASIAAIYAGVFDDSRIAGLVLMAPHFFVEQICYDSISASTVAFETTDLREKLAAHHGDNVDCAFWGWNRVWLENDFQEWNIEEYLPGITIPMLIIQGADDAYGTALQWQAAQNKSGGPVEIAELANCGHSPYREAPEKCLDASARFVRRILEIPDAGSADARTPDNDHGIRK
ncbi:MAG: alpha/beta hydrolase [Fimbriimonadaceae bacterium]|nr:alpha/beta hydrolase [Alphaproteobacteria bacterium]